MIELTLIKNSDPYFGWTEEKTKLYIEENSLKIGDQMLIVNTQAGMLEYVIAKVENPDSGRQHRVILTATADWGGASFYRSGKNCWSPTGQSRMIPPVSKVIEAFNEKLLKYPNATSIAASVALS
jgi:hypothetical protein